MASIASENRGAAPFDDGPSESTSALTLMDVDTDGAVRVPVARPPRCFREADFPASPLASVPYPRYGTTEMLLFGVLPEQLCASLLERLASLYPASHTRRSHALTVPSGVPPNITEIAARSAYLQVEFSFIPQSMPTPSTLAPCATSPC